MSREIEIKRKLKIRIHEGKILSYNSINDVFKNIFKCNMFNSNIKLGISNTYEPNLLMELNCNINKQLSTDLLMNELAIHFSKYNISKEENVNNISLEAIFYKREKINEKIETFCEKTNSLCNNEQSWFSIFVNDIELDLNKIQNIIETQFKEKVNKIEYVDIENFKTFTFSCSNEKKYKLDYEDFEIK